MNVIQSLYCNQYADLKKNGRQAGKARLNGMILFAAMVVLNLYTLVLLLQAFGADTELFRSVNRLLRGFGSGRGRGSGRLVALLSIALLVPLVYLIAGRESYFKKTIDSYEQLDPEKQKTAGNRGLYYVIFTFVFFFLAMIVALV